MSSAEQPWHAAFPAPRTTDPAHITKEDLLSRFKSGEKGGKDFLLVDLRRNDHEGGTITHSLNLSAQSLHPTLSTLYTLARSARIPLVIFYCGSSRGRGTRAAGWFADFIADADVEAEAAGGGGASGISSVILLGGIKGWVEGGEEYRGWMEGYVAEVWEGGDKAE